MAHEVTNDTYRQTNLANESEEYLAKREELRLAEIELMQHRERVAALRRVLPQGAPLRDYTFLEGPADLAAGDEPISTVKLSELFTAASRPLMIYHLMYGKKQTKPCPMCTMWIDGANGVAHHIAQNIDFAIVAAADPKALRDYARARGWNIFVCSALVPIPSNMTSPAKTPTACKIPPSPSSPKIPTTPSATSIPRIREWRRRSKNVVSTCLGQCGTSWI
jgi:Bacterial protein of unknown function (DUF899)